MSSVGKMFLIVGVVSAVVGLVLLGLGKAGVRSMPGDMSFGGQHWRFYFPLGTSIVVSIVLSIVLTLLFRLFNR